MFRWLAHKQACKLRSYASSKLSSVECDWATSIAKNSEQYLYVVRRALTRALWRSINGAQFCQMRSRRFSWATERGGGGMFHVSWSAHDDTFVVQWKQNGAVLMGRPDLKDSHFSDQLLSLLFNYTLQEKINHFRRYQMHYSEQGTHFTVVTR